MSREQRKKAIWATLPRPIAARRYAEMREFWRREELRPRKCPCELAPLPQGAKLLPLAEPRPDARRLSCALQSACVSHAASHEFGGFACMDDCAAYRPMTADEHEADLHPLADLASQIWQGPNRRAA